MENVILLEKPKHDPLYIDVLSNHSKEIVKEIHNMMANVPQKYIVTNMNLRKRDEIITKLSKRVFSMKKLSIINKVLLNVYAQEKLYGLTHHTVAMSKQNVGKTFMKLIAKHFLNITDITEYLIII